MANATSRIASGESHERLRGRNVSNTHKFLKSLLLLVCSVFAAGAVAYGESTSRVVSSTDPHAFLSDYQRPV